ncbi:MAG TPA: cytochrome c oxidase subunit II [Anaerolineaceae bacterium]|nr:cytochrome c oxidase subunit II [Anaerolineaceae bacterium]
MEPLPMEEPRRILIVSANPLFAQGLRRLSENWAGRRGEVVSITKNMAETLQAMDTLQPDLVIVDYDDETIYRDEFLSHFVASNRPMQVMLVSLRGGGEVVVYDRQTLTPSQAEERMKMPWPAAVPPEESISPRKTNMRHLVTAAVLVVLTTFLAYLGLTKANLLPVNASAQATPIDNLFNIHFIAMAFLFALIVVFMLYSVVVFRQRPGDDEDAAHVTGNNKLEIAWTILPLLTVLGVALYGARNLGETVRIDPDAMVINVTGGQWFWSFEYPDTGVISQTLALPVNRQVLLRMSSRDVIHSFWVPEFRVKQDLLPGENMIKELRITPTRVGQYELLCAEMCGVSHAYMTSQVLVMEDADFSAWMQQQSAGATADPVALGEKVAKDNGCTACHSVDGKPSVGPTWKGLYGSQRPLEDGTTVQADDDYLYRSIVDPHAQIAQGFPGTVMPNNYEEVLEQDQIRDVIEFIKSLK